MERVTLPAADVCCPPPGSQSALRPQLSIIPATDIKLNHRCLLFLLLLAAVTEEVWYVQQQL